MVRRDSTQLLKELVVAERTKVLQDFLLSSENGRVSTCGQINRASISGQVEHTESLDPLPRGSNKSIKIRTLQNQMNTSRAVIHRYSVHRP